MVPRQIYSGKVVQCFCPHCGAKLTTNTKKIDGQDTVHLITLQGKKIDVFLSAIWGNFKKEFGEEEIKEGSEIDALCPNCNKSLCADNLTCHCGAPLILVRSEDGIIGDVYMCSRVGCYNHRIQPDKIPSLETPNRRLIQKK